MLEEQAIKQLIVDYPIRLKVDYRAISVTETANVLRAFDGLIVAGWRSAAYQSGVTTRSRPKLVVDQLRTGSPLWELVFSLGVSVGGGVIVEVLRPLARSAVTQVGLAFERVRERHSQRGTLDEPARRGEPLPSISVQLPKDSLVSPEAIHPVLAAPDTALMAQAEAFALLASRHSVRFTISTPEGHAIEIDGRNGQSQ